MRVRVRARERKESTTTGDGGEISTNGARIGASISAPRRRLANRAHQFQLAARANRAALWSLKRKEFELARLSPGRLSPGQLNSTQLNSTRLDLIWPSRTCLARPRARWRPAAAK